MKFLNLIFALFFGLLIFSCAKKKYPEPIIVENEPVYTTTVTADGEVIKMRGGVDNYFMYSNITQDSNNVYNFQSEFKRTDCAPCPLSLKIQINDFKVSNLNEPVNIDSSLKIRRYQYLVYGATPEYQVQFTSSYSASQPSSISNFKWNFGDGQTYIGTTPTHVFTKAGSYQVCLSVLSNNSCLSTNCNLIKVGSNKLVSGILAKADTSNMIVFSNSTFGGKAPYNYLWNFGDGQTATTSSVTHYYSYAGSYGVTLRVIDAAGDTSISNFNAVTKSDLSSCAANLRVSSITALPGSQGFSKVAITWVDKNGVSYRSAENVQPSTSFFDIVSVSEGGTNEQGQPTKKVVVKFTCKVFNGTQSINLENAEATIAVAYK
jgi:PKD repeat protein